MPEAALLTTSGALVIQRPNKQPEPSQWKSHILSNNGLQLGQRQNVNLLEKNFEKTLGPRIRQRDSHKKQFSIEGKNW